MLKIDNKKVNELCISIAEQINFHEIPIKNIYPVLRGGYIPATILSKMLGLPLVSEPNNTSLVIDDIADSGCTMLKYKHFNRACLVKKKGVNNSIFNDATTLMYAIETPADEWVEFYWENTQEDTEDLIRRQLQSLGENCMREGLIDTPKRVAKMHKEIFRGYDPEQKPKVAIFKNGSDGVSYDQMITDTGDFYSHCEHHIVPFFGQYWFGYIPSAKGNIIGLSKVARLVDYHSARLQIQERLVQDIVDNIYKTLSKGGKPPLGIGLIMEAEHLCKSMRGVKKKGKMKSVKLMGFLKNDPKARAEFLSIIK